MPEVPRDSRKQHAAWAVELSNILAGREPRHGVEQAVIGGNYILRQDRPAPRASGSGVSEPLDILTAPAVEPEAPRTGGAALWPHLK
jgi:hypothetical protein